MSVNNFVPREQPSSFTETSTRKASLSTTCSPPTSAPAAASSKPPRYTPFTLTWSRTCGRCTRSSATAAAGPARTIASTSTNRKNTKSAPPPSVDETIIFYAPLACAVLDDLILWGYYADMIKSFGDRETERVFNGKFARKLPHDIQRVAERKLIMLHKSVTLTDLRVPPANRLEALRGKRQGQYSIRINDQWRICFEWREDGVYDVEITDYH